MKYMNVIVFVGLIVFVTGCQKKENIQPSSKKIQIKTDKQKVGRRGPTKLETKHSAQEKKSYADKILQK